MTPLGKHRPLLLLATLALALPALAGCIQNGAEPVPQTQPVLREMQMWVEPMSWEISPGVTTPVWAFCAEGDGVVPVHEGACGVPGPTLRVNKGDTVRLTFTNTHNIAHSVHLHGWHSFTSDFNGNGAMSDHMAVPPGESRTIEFVAEPAGTFIYHCHVQTPVHMDMGMYGAFIVDDPSVAVEARPDKEFVNVIDEWHIGDEVAFVANMPAFNYFTINGKSFPLTQPWFVEPGERVRLHFVNAGYQFHALHIHGHTPDSWEGVAGPKYAVPTDVREIAPGQSVVLELTADREGVWLAHDHVVPSVTAGANGAGYGAYPRGMLTALVVGKEAQDVFLGLAPSLVEAALQDVTPSSSMTHPEDEAAPAAGVVVAMKDFVFAQTEIHVKQGTRVTWMNRDPADHTVTSDDGLFDSGFLKPAASWSYTFDDIGSFMVHCKPHASRDADGRWTGMVMRVIVESGAP